MKKQNKKAQWAVRNSEKEDMFNRKSMHSPFYHKFFEGYSERLVPKQNGKGFRIERVYTGRMYSLLLSRTQRTLLKIAYIMVLTVAALLYVSATIYHTPSNIYWCVTIPEAIMFLIGLWMFYALVNYLATGAVMTISDYKSGPTGLKHSAFAAAFCALFVAMMTIVSGFLIEETIWNVQLVCAMKILGSALLFFAVYCIEVHLPYVVKDNDATVPDSAVEIT